MLSLFPFGPPRLGIAFRPDAISLVELTSRWRGRRAVRRAITEPIPSGVLVPSSDKPNVTDVAKLVEILRNILKQTRRRTAGVSLPMCSAHIGVFAFDQLSPRAEDRLAVLRWRFQHDEHIDVRDATIVHRVFTRKQANGSAHVLAVAVKREIVEQYERILEAAGLVPLSIGWSALQLFDMGRSFLTPSGEVFLVHDDPNALTVLAVRDGIPVFVRRKLGQSSMRDAPTELLRTLQYYDDLYPHHPTDQTAGASLLYQFTEPRDDASMRQEPSGEPSPTEILRPVGGSSWQIQLMTPAWLSPIRSSDRVNGMAEWSALASVCTA